MANKPSKEELRAALIKEKINAGLRPDQAAEVADRQIAHDEALEAAAAKPAKADPKK